MHFFHRGREMVEEEGGGGGSRGGGVVRKIIASPYSWS